MYEFRLRLNFVPKGPIDKNTAMVQIMTWRQTGHKPLSEPMMAKISDTNMSFGLKDLIRQFIERPHDFEFHSFAASFGCIEYQKGSTSWWSF